MRPDLLREYLEIEKEPGWPVFNGQSLADRVEAGRRKAA
jgi:hypothetical protein